MTEPNPYLESLFESLREGRLPQGAQNLYNARNQIYRFPSPMGDLVVKCFRVPSFINSLVYGLLRRTKAERSFSYSLQLQRVGLKVPEPVAYKTFRRAGRLRESYFVSRFVDAETIRNYENRPDCDEMLAALALEVEKFRNAHIWHKDFSPGNILVRRSPADGSYEFFYVDLNRLAFNDTYDDHTVRMFERINDSLEQTLRFARLYAPGKNIPAFLDRVAAAHKRFFGAKARLRRIRNLRRHPAD